MNLTATFELCQLAGRIMVAQGSGKIVNIASVLSFQGGFRVSSYAASKGGVSQLTMALANEWAPHGVNVNAIAPGYVKTALNARIWRDDPERTEQIDVRIPAGRWGEPADIGGAVVFLSSAAVGLRAGRDAAGRRRLALALAMDSSIFCFATDLADEGIETVLDNVEQRGGLGGVTVAAAYHEGRDVFPHNPVRKVRFLEGGAVFFPPGPALRAARLQPPVSEAAHVLPEVDRGRRPARARGPRVDGVPPQRRARRGAPRVRARERVRRPLRDRALPGASRRPRLRPRARRRHRGARCRRHLLGGAALPGPRARLRARALLRPARRARPLSARALLLRALPRRGAGGRRRRRRGRAASAREAIERAFAGDDPGGEPERDEYARVREQVVTSLVAEVAEAAGETPFEFIELSGAVKGYADGRPTGDPSPTIAWQLGVDVRRSQRACDGIEAMGYAADPELGRARPRRVRRGRGLRHLPPVDPRLRLGRGRCARRSSWPATASYAASTSTTTA